MPCLILTGHPCAGKSHVAQLIRSSALSRNLTVELISEDTACPDHSLTECYANSQAEKQTRGALKAAFDRTVSEASKNSLIILDSLNYIKGFRYELYCISKAAQQKHAVVWVLNDFETIQQCNQRRQQNSYTSEQLEELILRYEPPDDRNRWDQPLFRVDLRRKQYGTTESNTIDALKRSVYNMHNLSEALSFREKSVTTVQEAQINKPAASKRSTFKKFKKPTQASSIDRSSACSTPERSEASKELKESEQPDTVPLQDRVEQLLDQFLKDGKELEEGMSTRLHMSTDSNALQTVDALTQRICQSIGQAQSTQISVTVPASTDGSETINWRIPQKTISPAELRRVRSQFVQWCQRNLPDNSTEMDIALDFVAHLTETFK